MRSLLTVFSLFCLTCLSSSAEIVTARITSEDLVTILKLNFDTGTVIGIVDGEKDFVGTFTYNEEQKKFCDTTNETPVCAQLVGFKREVGQEFKLVYKDDMIANGLIVEIADTLS
ncbi:MAG: hypothetical protein AAFX02_09685 [Pseudomonadota bacterium]